MENVALYPHHASGTVETRDAMAQLVIDNLAAFFAGRPPLTPVNLPAVKNASQAYDGAAAGEIDHLSFA